MGKTEWKFQDRYTFKVVETLKDEPGFNELRQQLMVNSPPWEEVYSPEEKEQAKKLAERTKSLLSYRIGIYFENKVIGFTYCFQAGDDVLHMAASGVHPDHQRKGLYRELLRATLEFAKTEGFQTVESFHRVTNNAVIIAKLQAGFVITAVTVSDGMGGLVRLLYYFNPTRRKLMETRAGMIRPDERLRELFF